MRPELVAIVLSLRDVVGNVDALLCVGFTSMRAGSSQPGSGPPCGNTVPEVQFVHESLSRIEIGANRKQVLDTLACIAESGASLAHVRANAIRALFHLANDDADRQSRLMQLLRQPQLNMSAQDVVSKVLRYIVDVEGRAALLQEIQTNWPSRDALPAMKILLELNDPAFRTWFESHEEAMADDVGHTRWTSDQRKRLDIRKDPQSILAAPASDDTDIDRRWLVYEGLRLGVDRTQLRQSALAFLDREQIPLIRYGQMRMARACEHANIFLPEDAAQYGVIQELRTEWEYEADKLDGPKWATMCDQKRDQYYGLTPT